MKRQTKASAPRQNGEIYDMYDLRLTLLDLNKQGYALEIADGGNRLHVTCQKTHNRFVIKPLGHSDWPESI
ncbi:MAG TPA: hypothetical protein VFB79_03120 [Candidatus Angelobacter sp.]|nr:hypothetical protein [Candidatus Angelobacter sp.]